MGFLFLLGQSRLVALKEVPVGCDLRGKVLHEHTKSGRQSISTGRNNFGGSEYSLTGKTILNIRLMVGVSYAFLQWILLVL